MRFKTSLMIAAAGAALTFHSESFAQTATPSPAPAAATDLGEVVVTALKGSSSVQDTAATVDVLAGEALEEAGIRDLSSVTTRVPGTLAYSSPNGAGSVAIRGVGTGTAATSFDTSVGIFIDDVFAPRGRDFNTSLFDVANVQVLRGTQAAALGKNTSLGAMVVTTRRPDFTSGFNLTASHEFELGSNNVDFGANLPIGENFAVRLAGRAQDDEGWVHNDVTGSDAGGQEGSYWRLSALWKPNENLDILAYYQKEDVERVGSLFETFGPNPGVPIGESTLNYHQQQSISGQPTADSMDEFEGERALLNIAYRTDRFNVTSITGWRRDKLNLIVDQDISARSFGFQHYGDNTDQWSQEFRFDGDFGPVKWVGGLLYYVNDWGSPILTGEYPESQICAPTVSCGVFFEDFRQKTEAKSVYAQLNWTITDQWDVTAGARYTDETKTIDTVRYFINGYTTATGFVFANRTALMEALRGSYAPRHIVVADDALDGGVTLRYRLNDDFNIYASWGQGTKSGGVQNLGGAVAGVVPLGIYAPEVAKTWEAGFKWNFGKGHLYGAAFKTDVEDFQNAVFNGVSFVITQEQVESKGVEWDASYAFTDNFSVDFQGTYTKTVYDDGTTPVTLVGTQFLRAPLWSYTLSASYRHPISSNYTLSIEPRATFRDEVRFSTTPFVPYGNAVTTYDLRIALENEEQGWELALLGRNMTDEKVISYAVPSPAGPPRSTVTLDRPRTVALQFSISR